MLTLRKLALFAGLSVAAAALPGCFFETDDDFDGDLEIEAKPGKIEIDSD